MDTRLLPIKVTAHGTRIIHWVRKLSIIHRSAFVALLRSALRTSSLLFARFRKKIFPFQKVSLVTRFSTFRFEKKKKEESFWIELALKSPTRINNSISYGFVNKIRKKRDLDQSFFPMISKLSKPATGCFANKIHSKRRNASLWVLFKNFN